MDFQHKFVRLRGWVEVDNKPERFDISSITARFAVNDIPTCSISMAVGVDPFGGLATSHQKAADLGRRVPIKAYIFVDGNGYDGLEKGVYRVFDGYVSSISPTRGTGAASLVIQAIHWLSDLTLSNKMCSAANPATSLSLLQPALRQTNSTIPGWIPNFRGVEDANLWQEIKNSLSAVADMEEMHLEGYQGCVKDSRKATLDAVLAKLDDSKNIDTMPLIISNAAANYRSNVFQQIPKYVLSFDSGVTFLDAIKYCARQYMFYLVPNCNSATCVPLMRQFNGTPYKTIYASEYRDARHNFTAGLPLRGIGFLLETRPATMDKNSTRTGNNRAGLCGMYDVFMENSGADEKTRQQVNGQVEFLPAPAWIILESDTTRSVAILKDTLHQPRVSDRKGNSASNSTPRPVEEAEKAQKPIGCSVPTSQMGMQLAKAIYLDKVFGPREISIDGKLRFDIAPGSCIALEVIGKALPGMGEEGPMIYGNVGWVSFTVNAEHSQASTTFGIQSVRTEREQRSPGTSTSTHPVYTNIWSGTYLSRPLTRDEARTAGSNTLNSVLDKYSPLLAR